MHRIVFLDRASLRADLRKPSFPHQWSEFDHTQPGDVVPRLRDSTIAITNKVPLREETLTQLPSLKLIAVSATGVDIIDLESCRRRGISVCNVRNYATHSVPEHVFSLMLCLRRNLFNLRNDVQAGAWAKTTQFCLLDHHIRELHGATLGLIGYGALAQGVERIGNAFGMRIIIAERKGAMTIRPGRCSFEEVLRDSDIMSLHAPLTAETRGMIGASELRAMKPEAILINTARGGLVDEAALAEAIRTGIIAGAGVDVLSSEPPREGNPLLELNSPNLIVTPHVAWASDEAMQVLADQLIDNVEAFAAGNPRNLIK
jgi:glycerate dehydrogenase